jgi:hypothetical protein
MQRSSDVILSLIPARTHAPASVTAIGQHKTGGPGSAGTTPAKKTYQADVRRALDHLIAATRSEGEKR